VALLNAQQLQSRLCVTLDGKVGAGTLGALFSRAGAKPEPAAELGLAANAHFRTYGILDTPLRLAHFMAQCAHESGGFLYNREIWGPTEAQRGYEGAARLGNTQLGRGPGQLTGRANYRNYGRKLGIDFETHPELVEIWSIGLLAFCAYWGEQGLNLYADADNLRAVSNGINRGNPNSDKDPNGWADRQQRYAAMKGLIL
jgi:putative chitinase